jgi:peptide/nickel transport system substrate-binding protein
MNIHDKLSQDHRWRPGNLCFRFLAGALLLWISIISLFQPGSAQATRSRASAAGDYVVAIGVDVVQLDPALANDSNSFLVANQIFDTLVKHQPGGSIPEPGLAESWTISPNGLLWTFNLRSGVKFHDGTTVDASAVVYNLERWWDPAHPAHIGSFEYFSFIFGGFKGDSDCLIAGIAAVGASQVQITLSRPYAPLPSMLDMPAFSIASPTAIQLGTLSSLPVGSGPFKFVDWLPGDRLHLDANPSYWAGAPRLGTLTFRVIPSEADRFLALPAGSVHSVGDLPDSYATIAASASELQVLWRPSANIGYLGINRAHTPLDNLQVRQAIAHAVNWQNLINNHYTPGDQLASQFLPPAIWGYNPSLTAYTYDPALSISLLAQAGYPAGFSTTLSYRPVIRVYLPNPADTANAIKNDLEAVGILTTVIEYESNTFLNKYVNGELDLFLLGWGADYLHPDNFYTFHLCNPGNLGFGPLDALLCSNLQAALAEPDFDQQVIDYQAAGQRIYDTLPFVPIVHARSALLVRQNVAGLVASPSGFEEYRTAYFAEAVQVVVVPETGVSLVYTDAQSEPTTIEVPAEAVTQTTILRYVAMGATSIPSGYGSANHAFELNAFRDGELLVGFIFEQPITITIDYTDADVSMLHEDTLLLYAWDGNAWVDAATTCAPASTYVRNLTENRLSVSICHLSRFALLGELLPRIFLPMLVRQP